jgi:hypothetical protein
MKKICLIIGSAVLMVLAGCSNPTDYNTSIMNEVRKVENADQKILKEITCRQFENIEIALQEGRDQINASLRKLDKFDSFRGDDSLRKAAISYISLYESLFKKEYETIISLLKKGKKFTSEDESELAKLMETFAQDKRHAKNTFSMIHFDFIKKNGLIPVEIIP